MKKIIKKMLTICTMFGCAMLLCGVNANAYIDPSVMTYMIQLIAGVAVAVSAIATVYIRKAKKKISEKFGIDENKNKEVESDEIIVNIIED